MRLPKILQVVGDGRAGGGTTAVLTLSRAIADRGFPVTVATQAGSYAVHEAHRLGLPTLQLNFASRANSLSISKTLKAMAFDNGPIILHAHGARAGLPASLVPRTARTALIYTVHGFHYGHKKPGVRDLARWIERLCVSRATTTVFVSRSDYEAAVRDGIITDSNPYEVIYNGSKASPPSTSMPEGERYDIAFLGRLHYQKNPLMLADILLAMWPPRPQIRIIGGGEYEPELKRRVAEAGLEAHFEFLGEQSHSDALYHLAGARVMLLPSKWEGLPISVIEAMHLQLPVVASNVAGTNELVVDGTTGFLIDASDARGFAVCLRRLLSDENLRRRMGQAAMLRAREVFSFEQQVSRHVALYQRLGETGSSTTQDQAA